MPFPPFLVLPLLAVLLLLLEGWGGAGQPIEVDAIRMLGEWRSQQPQATGWIILLTHLGGAPFLLAVAAAGGGWLLWRRMRSRAALLALAVLGGRLGVELLKLVVDRPRPGFEAHPVAVFSQSFPSGHAANSMITYLALAVFVVPERWRRQAVCFAVLLALAIGATRPLLGVHWPSDVVAGWLYGAVVVWALARFSRP